jgi:hypothetical protein
MKKWWILRLIAAAVATVVAVFVAQRRNKDRPGPDGVHRIP